MSDLNNEMEQNYEGSDSEQTNQETQETGDNGDVTRTNIDKRQGVVRSGRNANEASTRAMVEGATQEEQSQEELWEKAKQEGKEIFERQQEFDERINEEISHAEEMKEAIEETGDHAAVDNGDVLNLKEDSEYDESWISGFMTPGSGTDPVPLPDGIDTIETDATRWGTFAGDFVMYKKMFDRYKQEAEEENRSAAESTGKYGGLASDASQKFDSHLASLKADVTEMRDELHLTERDTGNSEVSRVENLRHRIEVYQEVDELVEETIENYEESQSEADPSIPEDASSAIRNLLGVAEDRVEDAKAEFDADEKEAAKTAWSMTRVEAADSMSEMYDQLEEGKERYEEAKEEVRNARSDWIGFKHDVENLTDLEEVSQEAASNLNELGVTTKIDLAVMDSGAELLAQLDDSPYSDTDDRYIKGRADKFVQEAKEEVHGSEDDDGIASKYGLDTVDDKVERVLDSTGQVSKDTLVLEQLSGAYSKSDDVIRALADLEERFQEELNSYDEAIDGLEEELGVDDVEEYIERERSEAYGVANDLLDETDQIEA